MTEESYKIHRKIMAIYKSMIHRTTVDKPSNKYWFGKGIKIYDKWLADPEAFYIWAINNGYKEGLTIDRIDNNKDYEPNNCQWITRVENSRKAGQSKKGHTYKKTKLNKRENLKLFRMQQGLLSKEMADILNVSPSYYSNIENGIIDPSYDFAEKFGDIFKGKYDDFWNIFARNESPKN